MQIDSLGVPQFSEQDLVDMIYKGDIDKCYQVLCEHTPEIKEFNQAAKRFGDKGLAFYSEPLVDKPTFDSIMQSEWFMPDEYKELDIDKFVMDKCSTDEERARADSELKEYGQRSMQNILRYMVYLVDFMRENKIVWGVGRGSSVASFVLYLIGIHRIHSIQYGLDFNEFMR